MLTRGASIRTLVLGLIAVAMLVGTGVVMFWPDDETARDTLGEALPEFGPLPERGTRGELPPRPELDFAPVPEMLRGRTLPGGLPTPPGALAASTELARLYLESVRGHLETVESDRRAVLLAALLERGVDAPLAGGFAAAEDGYLRQWPSLRLAWLDSVCRLDGRAVTIERLADLASLASSGAPASEAAATRALVGLARRQPAAVFGALQREPGLFDRAPRARAAVFATADRNDVAQRAALEAYLARADLSAEERAAFAQAVPPVPVPRQPTP